MRKTTSIASAIGALSLLAATTVWACSAVGPNSHVGVLLAIDEPGQSFTVLDAETNRPVTFLADEKLLARLASAKGQILVDFEAQGSKLRATDVRF